MTQEPKDTKVSKPTDNDKKRMKRYVQYNLLGMFVFCVLVVVGIYLSTSIYTHHGENISVPDVTGMNVDAATAKLEALGLEVVATDTVFFKSKPNNTVVDQSIVAGHEVKEGRLVRLTISTTQSRLVTLPDIADNCSLNEARAKLTALGFRLGNIEYVSGEGSWVYGVKVNGREVAKGARVSVESPIVLLVGNGSGDEEFNGDWELDQELGLGEETDSI